MKVTRERAGEGGREGFNRSPIPKVPDTSCHPDPDSLLSSPGEERAPISISWQTYVTLRLLLGYLERETLLPTCSSGLHTWRERVYKSSYTRTSVSPLPFFMPVIPCVPSRDGSRGPPKSRIKNRERVQEVGNRASSFPLFHSSLLFIILSFFSNSLSKFDRRYDLIYFPPKEAKSFLACELFLSFFLSFDIRKKSVASLSRNSSRVSNLS